MRRTGSSSGTVHSAPSQRGGMSLRGRPGSGAHPYAVAANGYQPFTPEPMPAQQQPGSLTGYTVPVPVSVYTEHTAYQAS